MSQLSNASKTAGLFALGLAAALALGAPEAKAQEEDFQCPNAPPPGVFEITVGGRLQEIPGGFTREQLKTLYDALRQTPSFIPTQPIDCGFFDEDENRYVVVRNPRITVTEDFVPAISAWHQGSGDLVVYAHSVKGNFPHEPTHFDPHDYGRHGARTLGDGDFYVGEESHGVWAEHTGEGRVGIDFRDLSLSTAGGDFAVGLYASQQGSYVFEDGAARRAKGAVIINVIENDRDRANRARPLLGTRGDESDAIRAEYTRAAAFGNIAVTVEGYTIATGGIVLPGPQIPNPFWEPPCGTEGDPCLGVGRIPPRSVPALTGYQARGIYASHEGHGDVRIKATDSHILTWGIDAHGIFADHKGKTETITNLDMTTEVRTGGGAIEIDVTEGRIVTAGDSSIAIYGSHRGSSVGGKGGVDIDATGVTVETAGEEAHGILAWVRPTLDDDDEPIAGTGVGDVAIDVTGGSISTEGAEAHAVWAKHEHEGDIAITLKDGATVATAGAHARGVLAEHRGAGGDIDVTGGAISTQGAGAHGVQTLRVGDGGLNVAVAGGATVTTQGSGAHGVQAQTGGDGDLTLDVSGATVTTQGSGAHGVQAQTGGDGDLTLDVSGATVTTQGSGAHGVQAQTGGDGDLTLDVSGATVAAQGESAVGIYVVGDGAGDLSVDIDGGASVTSTGVDGIAVLVRYSPLTVTAGPPLTAGAGGAAPSVAAIPALPANEHAGTVSITVAEGVTITGTGTGISVTGGAESRAVRVDGEVTGGTGPAIYLESGGAVIVGANGEVKAGSQGHAIVSGITGETGMENHLIVTVEGRVEGNIIVQDDSDLVLLESGGGTVVGDIFPVGGGTVTAPPGLNVVRTLGGLQSPHTVSGTVGRLLFTLEDGAMVTITENGRITGVDGEAIVNEVGNLEVELQAGEGETPLEAAGRIDGVIRTSGDMPEVCYKEPGEDCGTVGLAGTAGALPIGIMDLGLTHEGNGSYRLGSSYGPRARVYEALPALLLGLNRVSTYRDRMAAPRGASGSWARVAAEGGRWKARSSTSTAAEPGRRGAGIAFDYNRYAAQAGLDLPLTDCECDSVGVSAHYRHGTAELPQPGGWGPGRSDGRILASGFGFAVSGARRFEGGAYDGVYVDGQVAATWYDVKLESGVRGLLKSGARAFGYAVAVEVGREIPMGEAGLLTPRARLAHSQVGMTAFTDSVEASVAIERGRSLTGQLGVGMEFAPSTPDLEGVRLFGALDVEGELTPETRTRAAGTSLASRGPGARARLELGLSHEGGDGRYAARGAVHATTGGGGTGYGGEMSFLLRF